MFDQSFLSPLVNRSVIISNTYDICELSHQLPNDLRLRKLRKVVNISKILKLDTITQARSSHWRCSVKKGVLKNFAKFTGKHLCQSLSFNKVAGLRSATLLKKRLWRRCFPVNFAKFLAFNFIKKETLSQVFSCEFCKISKNTFFTEHLRTNASAQPSAQCSSENVKFFNTRKTS